MDEASTFNDPDGIDGEGSFDEDDEWATDFDDHDEADDDFDATAYVGALR